MTTEPKTASVPATPSLVSQLTWWVLVLPAAMIVALVAQNNFLLNYTHVLSGVLWTGADLFLGFILGPVMRRLNPLQRKAVITYLVPRTLLIRGKLIEQSQKLSHVYTFFVGYAFEYF